MALSNDQKFLNGKWILTLSFSLAISISYIRLRPFNDDSWDSARLPIFKSSTNTSFLLDRWFGDASMFEQLVQVRIFFGLSDMIGMEYYAFRKVFLIILSALIASHVAWVILILTDKPKLALFGSILSIFFPTWPISSSSVLDYYVLALFLGTLGSQLAVQSKGKLGLCLGLVMILFSTGYGVMNSLIPIFMLLLMSCKSKYTSFERRKRFLVVILFISVKYATSRLLFPPKGQYEGYNQILRPDSSENWTTIVLGAKAYSSFLLPLAIVISIPVLHILIFSRFNNENSLERKSENRLTLLLSCLLFPAAVVPYVLVGKSTSLFWIEFNSGRHAIPLLYVIPICLAVVSNQLISLSQSLGNELYWSLQIAYLLIFIVFLIPHQKSWNQRLHESNIRQSIMELVSSNRLTVMNGTVNVIIPKRLNYEANVFDANLLFLRATGGLSHFATVTSDLAKARRVPPSIEELTGLLLPISLVNTCLTTINLTEEFDFEKTKLSSNMLDIQSVVSRCDSTELP